MLHFVHATAYTSLKHACMSRYRCLDGRRILASPRCRSDHVCFFCILSLEFTRGRRLTIVGVKRRATAHYLRIISSDKEERRQVQKMLKLPALQPKKPEDKARIIEIIRLATYAGFLCSFIQGLNVMLFKPSAISVPCPHADFTSAFTSYLQELRRILIGMFQWPNVYRSGELVASSGADM